jgi:YcxB-like protein
MGCYWRHSRVKWFALVCMPLLLLGTACEDFYPGDSGTPRTVSVLSVFLDLLPLVCFFGILFVVISVFGRLTFRRSAFFNKELVYALDESGIHVHSPLMNSEVDWALYGRATESSRGFAIFQKGGRSFSWLPKDGFDSQECVKRCRELLREKIQKNSLFAT